MKTMNAIGKLGKLIVLYQDAIEIALLVLLAVIVLAWIADRIRRAVKRRYLLKEIDEKVDAISRAVSRMEPACDAAEVTETADSLNPEVSADPAIKETADAGIMQTEAEEEEQVQAPADAVRETRDTVQADVTNLPETKPAAAQSAHAAHTTMPVAETTENRAPAETKTEAYRSANRHTETGVCAQEMTEKPAPVQAEEPEKEPPAEVCTSRHEGSGQSSSQASGLDGSFEAFFRTYAGGMDRDGERSFGGACPQTGFSSIMQKKESAGREAESRTTRKYTYRDQNVNKQGRVYTEDELNRQIR